MVFKKLIYILKRALRFKPKKSHKRKRRNKKIHSRSLHRHKRNRVKKFVPRRRGKRRISKKRFRKIKRVKVRPSKRKHHSKRKTQKEKLRSSKKKNRNLSKRKGKRAKTVKPIKIGIITHYFPKAGAAVVKLNKSLQIGEAIWIKGKISDFRQTVGSLQIDRVPIDKAASGKEVGLEVFKDVRPGDIIYLSR